MKSIHVVARTLPEGWERAVLQCWEQGAEFRTEYDKPDDPASRDVVAMVHVTEPMSEPRIHRAIPAGLDDLEKYRNEVVHGVHDHRIAPDEGKWQYTYHQRMRAYEVPGVGTLDQLAAVVDKLREAGHTRRAQAVTWQAWEDQRIDDPACLQRLWFRLEEGRLNMTAHMRSNDAYKAAFMNMYAFTDLQAELAEQLGVEAGEYVHIADSFHIYGSYFADFEGFLNTVRQREPEDRSFTTEFALPMFLDGVAALLAEPDMPPAKRELLQARKQRLESAG